MNKIVNEVNVVGKKVIVRVDFNVTIKNGKVVDSKRIDDSLKTINYLIAQGSKIILMSHLGKVKNEDDKSKNTLRPVYDYLVGVLNTNVFFSEFTRGIELENLINSLTHGDVLLMENTRFEDLNSKAESSCNEELSTYWASLADIFVFDAFGSAHRSHASTSGLARKMNSCLGFLVNDEINKIDTYVMKATHPFTIVMGGAKVDDKLSLIKSLIDKCDYMLVAGGIANSFLKVLDVNVGESLVTKDTFVLDEIKAILLKDINKIILPTDVIVGKKYDPNYVKQKSIESIESDDVILDIGYNTLNSFKDILVKSTQTLFMNGTVGLSEDVKFANGTKEILSTLDNCNYVKVAGGGDAVLAINKFGHKDSFTFLSTGGGATLNYIADGSLVVIDEVKRGIECL